MLRLVSTMLLRFIMNLHLVNTVGDFGYSRCCSYACLSMGCFEKECVTDKNKVSAVDLYNREYNDGTC